MSTSTWIEFRVHWMLLFYDLWVYRVTYPNGDRTRLLGYREAKSLKDNFGGKLWIDYEFAKQLL